MNNSTDCYSFTNSTSHLIINLSVYGATTSIGAVSCLTAIFLILVAKAYKEFIYRLLLYMAVDGLLGCLAALVYNTETDYNIPHTIAMTTNLLMNYFIYVYCLQFCWIGLHLFSLAVFRVNIKKAKHEAIGLVTVLVSPFTFLWVFPWMTRERSLCENTYNLKELKLVLLFNIPIISSAVLTSIFIGAVLMMLCKNAINRAENTLQHQHRKAVRETIPLLVFVSVHQISAFVTVGILVCQLFLAMEKERSPFFLWELFDLWPIDTVSIPILLLVQPHIRRRIKCRRSPTVQVTTDNERATIIHQSSGVQQPSNSYCSIPHETSSVIN